MALTAVDGSVSGGRRSTDRESGGKRSVSLPSRYLEELESVSSPGVVSKKAAYFEEAIRFASGEKCRPSADGNTMGQVDDDGDSTARTLQFSWDSEEPPASENPPEQLDRTEQEHSGENSGAENEIQLCDSPDVEKRELSDDKSCQSNDTDVANGEELLKENKDPRPEGNDSGKATRTFSPKSRDCCQQAPVSEKPAAPSIKGGSLRSSCSGVPGTASRLCNPLSRSTNFTKPQPFALSTEKRRQSGRNRSSMGSEKAVKQNGEESRSSFVPLAADYAIRRHRQPVHKQEARSLAGRGTSARAFVLKSDERAEKRKEFYTKLGERTAAREQEKNQMKAKSQDEKEAEIRKLRQSLTFKATPMPSFYHACVEQPTAERRKSPATLTRPVSPKLGRQKRGEASKRPCQHAEMPSRAKATSSSSSSASSKVSARASKPSSPEAMELSDGCSVFLKEEDEAILLPGSV